MSTTPDDLPDPAEIASPELLDDIRADGPASDADERSTLPPAEHGRP